MKNWLKAIKTDWQSFEFFSHRSINSMKTACACILGYLLVLFAPLPHAQWIVITTLIVMSTQSSFGGLLLKSYMRFWGTVAGAVIAILGYLLVGNDPLWLGVVLFCSTLLFAYVSGSQNPDISVAGALGAVTVALILLLKPFSIATAGMRFAEIVLGIGIALAVSSLILPIPAHTLVKKNLANTLAKLSEHLSQCLTITVGDLSINFTGLDQAIIGRFARQRKLIHEMEVEPKFRKQTGFFQQLLQMEIKIYRAANFMYVTSHANLDTATIVQGLVAFPQFKQHVTQLLLDLSASVRSGKSVQIDATMEHLLTQMQQEVKQNFYSRPYEHVSAVNAFLFAANLLSEQIKAAAADIEQLAKI